MYAEMKDKLDSLRKQVADLREALRVEENLVRLKAIEAEMAQPGFWNDQEKAQGKVRELKELKASTLSLLELARSHEENAELLELLRDEGDPGSLQELAGEIEKLEERVRSFSIQALFCGKDDFRNVYLSIQAGAGGTESCDWALMLLRMYSRWIEREGFALSLIDRNPHDEAGIKSAALHVKGSHAYGHLRSERGIHRLVRISPFDAGNRRHTSFASVDVVPEVDDTIEIELNESDLRVDTYRSSGAGGQHVNVTDSAVRITHLPTKITVQCQNERSQHANRRVALALLKAKLYQMEQQKRDDEMARLYGEKGEIAWGNQIRSYVMQPYQLVKDHRTSLESSNVNGILDGDLDPFIEAYLRWMLAKG